MDKLGNKLAKLLVVPAASFVMALTVYAAAPTANINYLDENVVITAVTTATTPVEYSLNKTTWTPLLGHTIDVSTLMGKSIYVREIGKTSLADMLTIAVPRRPEAPASLTFTPTTTSPTGDKINMVATHQFQVDNLGWQLGTGGGVDVGQSEKLGATFTVRTKATDADGAGDVFASLPKTVSVSKRAAAPDVKYDETKDGIPAKDTWEYKNAKTGAGASWLAVTADGLIDRNHAAYKTNMIAESVNGEDKKFIYFRIQGSSDNTASEVIKVEFPDKQTVAPVSVMDIENEKITDVNNSMEYRVLTTLQGTNESYATPSWTPVSGTEINLKNSFSPEGTIGNTLKEYVQVRYKAIPKTNVAAAKPASTEQEFKLAARPIKPTNVADATGVTFNYATFEGETIAVAATNQYKIGTGQWKDGNSSPIKIVDELPATGKLDLVLRVKAVTSSANPPVYTPASAEYRNSFLAIAARPATPTAKFTAYALDKNEISGLTTKMQYKDPNGAAGGGTDVTSFKDIAAADIPLKLDGTLDSKRDVTVRVKTVGYTAGSVMAVPMSGEQVITCEFLPKVTEISGTVVFTPDDLTGLDTTKIGTFSFPNYSFTGTKAATPDITYSLGALPLALKDLVTITDGGSSGTTAPTAFISVATGITGGIYTIPVIVTYTDALVLGTAVKHTDYVTFVITNPIEEPTVTLVAPVDQGNYPGTVVAETEDLTYTVESTTWSGGAGGTATKWDEGEVGVAVVRLRAVEFNTFTGLAAADITAIDDAEITYGPGQGVSNDGTTVTFTVTFDAIPEA